jgi:hypothetical protein
MQLIDIVIATGYAAICLSLIVVINPIAPREAAVEAATQMRLDSALSVYIANVGLPFLATSSAAAICQTASDASNATVVFDVYIQGDGCGSLTSATLSAPPLASSSITLDLPGREVMIEVLLGR